MPNLEEHIKQSEIDRKVNSKYLSTMLDEGESVECEKYVGEEIVTGQYGQQLQITVICNGQEKVLGRPYPLSNDSLNFMKELIKVRKNPPFIIKKDMGKRGFPVYSASAVAPAPAK
jgi:hypothetical protein